MPTITTFGPGDPTTWPACSGHGLDPRHDDEATDLELSEAESEFLTDTWATSNWLIQNLKQPELQITRTPLRVAEEDVCDLTLDQLWVLMMSGTDKQLIAARFELVSRMTNACAADIEARVPAIRASNLQDAADSLAESLA